MTYAEEIESLNQQLQRIYERAGQLWDVATTSETRPWQNIKYFSVSSIDELLTLKATMSPERLDEKVPCVKNKASFS